MRFRKAQVTTNALPIAMPPTRPGAAEYLRSWLDISPLASDIGLHRILDTDVILHCNSIPPEDYDYELAYSRDDSLCSDWLRTEIANHLNANCDSLVMLEDTVSAPSDPFLLRNEHPIYWSFKDRMFWPVLGSGMQLEQIESIESWMSSFRQIVFFSRLPSSLKLPDASGEISGEALSSIGKLTTRIMTDVFRGNGYLEWRIPPVT